MSLDGAEARGVRQTPGADVAQPLDLHYCRLRVREPLPVAEFRLPVPAKNLQDLLPHLGLVLLLQIVHTVSDICTYYMALTLSWTSGSRTMKRMAKASVELVVSEPAKNRSVVVWMICSYPWDS